MSNPNDWELPKKGYDTPRTTEKPTPMLELDATSDAVIIKAMFQRVGISFNEINTNHRHTVGIAAPDAGFEPIEFCFDEVGELISVTAAPWYDR